MFIDLKNIINQFFLKFGYRISKSNNSDELVKIHKYKNYEEYKATQIFYNKKKINHIWADEFNLTKIADFLKKNINKKNIKGICHGSRNGFEQNFFNKNILNSKVFGTDISDTAIKYKDSIVWDFHKTKREWIDNFDFVYSNSLDQSFDPKTALTNWIQQINKNGYVIVEHTDQHSVRASGKMDPFGVEPNFFPYLITEWFGHSVTLKIVKSVKPNKSKASVWLFFIKKL
jgi:hypothetical protein